MTEIEKLYENAGINQVCNTCELSCFKRLCPTKKSCVRVKPSFTAEKQLELIKWLGEWDYTVRIDFHENEWGIATENNSGYFQDNLSDALASIINNLWQDLTEQEKEQIKEILEDISE